MFSWLRLGKINGWCSGKDILWSQEQCSNICLDNFVGKWTLGVTHCYTTQKCDSSLMGKFCNVCLSYAVRCQNLWECTNQTGISYCYIQLAQQSKPFYPRKLCIYQQPVLGKHLISNKITAFMKKTAMFPHLTEFLHTNNLSLAKVVTSHLTCELKCLGMGVGSFCPSCNKWPYW